MGWMILKDATETHGVLYWGDTPQDFVDMLWHHSKAHVSPAMFKRTIAMNNLCELIRADTPTCLIDDFNLMLGKIVGEYRNAWGREPYPEELANLVEGIEEDDAPSTPEYDKKIEDFFAFWSEWYPIEKPSPEHPACYAGATVTAIAVATWEFVKEEGAETFCKAMAGDAGALQILDWAREDIAETLAMIEQHYLAELGRKPFPEEIAAIATGSSSEEEKEL